MLTEALESAVCKFLIILLNMILQKDVVLKFLVPSKYKTEGKLPYWSVSFTQCVIQMVTLFQNVKQKENFHIGRFLLRNA